MSVRAGGWDKNSTVGKHASSNLTQTVAIEGLADAYMGKKGALLPWDCAGS